MRHFHGLQSLLSTLAQASKELGLLMVLLFVCVLTFSRCINNINIYTTRLKHLLLLNKYLARFSLIYFAEKESAARWSFPDSFWWGLMVLTTVIMIMIMIMINSIHLRII